MKFGRLTEYNKRNIFFKNHAENVAGRLVPDLFLFFIKALYEEKAWNDKLWVVSYYFEKINLRVASYYLWVSVLKQ